ncbi:MAG TPA: hypothetical protein VFH23_05460 [Jiangellaceae bacterium]|nr:hypothetical protein [Jiangellaceae bacterium]
MNEARAEELRLPDRREELRREAAHRIQGLTRERRLDGFGSIVLNPDAGSLTLYWKGPLPQEMDELLDELGRDVAIDVRDAPYSKDELFDGRRRLFGRSVSIPSQVPRVERITSRISFGSEQQNTRSAQRWLRPCF